MKEISLEEFNNKYISYNLLGSGAFSEVYLIENFETKEKFAAKYIRFNSLNSIISINKELDILLYLNNIENSDKYIIKLIEYVKTSNLLIIISDLADKGDYITYTEEIDKKDYSPKQIFYKICKSVEFLHDNNIIHRDLKIDNILLYSNKNIKLCDFGSAIYSNSITDEIFTTSIRSLNIGTLEYSSPELLNYTSKKLNFDKDISFATDIWSLGVILFILNEGTFPFSGDEQTIKNNIRMCNFNTYNTNKKYRKLLKHLLVKDPNKRYTIKDILKSKYF